MRSSRLTAVLGTLAAVAMLATACGSDDSGSDSTTAAPTATTAGGDATTAAPAAGGDITVGSADFTESQILGEIYAQALEAKGFTVKRELNIGARPLYFAAIVKGEVDVLPEYTNSLLVFALQQTDPNAVPTATDVASQVTELGTALPAELQILTPSTAEDKDTIVCTSDIATKYSLTDLSSLFKVAGEITLGGPPEFESRTPFGVAGFEAKGATFKSFVPLQAGSIADALSAGSIDCANMFSTDPAIASNGFVALDDDLNLVANEAVVPLVRKDTVGGNADATAALDAVSAALTTEGLTAMIQQVQGDAQDPTVVAKQFITDNNLG
jgi:osmoprotectant transport system substrate-binding protein